MAVHNQVTFTDADVVNLDDWIPACEYNPHNKRPYLLHDHGFVLAVVFADCLQDALDEACDADKLTRYKLDTTDAAVRNDYMTTDVTEMAAGYDPDCPELALDGVDYWWKTEPTFLGNSGEPHDIEGLDAFVLPNPPRSFCAQFTAAFNF